MVPAKDRRAGGSSSGKIRARPRRKRRRGLPNKSSIVSIRTLTTRKGNRYRIIETDERDAYDRPAGPTSETEQ